MTNVQQPEMRRSENNPLVTDSKVPKPTHRPTQVKGGEARPVPPDQVSPYGPSPRPVAGEKDDERESSA